MTAIIHNDDCFNILKMIPNKSIDLFICDLPYSRLKFGRSTACKWDRTIDLDKLWIEFKRLRKTKKTPFVFFCNVKHGYDLISSNPRWYRYEVCYQKSLPTGFLNSKHQPLRATEYLYFFYENLPIVYTENIKKHHKKLKRRKGNDMSLTYKPKLPTSMLNIKTERGSHQTQKSTKIIKWILKYYSKDGDTVLDPTMGSGSVGVACKQTNRNFIGIEDSAKIFKIAQTRIKKAI
jgi:site-specific DNA-methyltransferase (adenine-specific)|tara:strand:- start:492 stop:1193 length:702 start_codon:yes stop_codon:yes gene_type:complete